MKTQRFAGVTIAILAVCTSVAFATNFPPKPTQLVTDNANMMTTADRAALEQELRAYNTKTSNVIAVLTVPSLDGLTVDEYANELFHSWGIGKKGDDNGVLLLFAPTEKKVRIEVGYGLEEYLTDGACGDIIRDPIHDLFESGNRSQSVVKGAEAVMTHLGDTPYPSRHTQDATGNTPSWLFAVVSIAVIGFGVIVFSIASYRRRRVSSAEDRYDTDPPEMIPSLRHEVVTFPEPLSPRSRGHSRASSPIRHEEEEERPREEDDDSSLATAAIVASAASSSDDDEESSSSVSSSVDTDTDTGIDLGGGDSGGGGASGDL